jgi:hypothetical protein
MGFLALIIKSLSDSLLASVFKFIQDEMQKRALVAQGRAEQHTADLAASVKEGRDAAATDESVRALDDSQLDAGLEQVRRNAAAGARP